ncbi:hypothetical protein F5Y15DRAFT_418158 [Xylariaceae sp. FL0016]|nr:hypothetical protein F5Y15DRAFT_418158 [Xylariaceae sp. FL0016]
MALQRYSLGLSEADTTEMAESPILPEPLRRPIQFSSSTKSSTVTAPEGYFAIPLQTRDLKPSAAPTIDRSSRLSVNTPLSPVSPSPSLFPVPPSSAASSFPFNTDPRSRDSVMTHVTSSSMYSPVSPPTPIQMTPAPLEPRRPSRVFVPGSPCPAAGAGVALPGEGRDSTSPEERRAIIKREHQRRKSAGLSLKHSSKPRAHYSAAGPHELRVHVEVVDEAQSARDERTTTIEMAPGLSKPAYPGFGIGIGVAESPGLAPPPPYSPGMRAGGGRMPDVVAFRLTPSPSPTPSQSSFTSLTPLARPGALSPNSTSRLDLESRAETRMQRREEEEEIGAVACRDTCYSQGWVMGAIKKERKRRSRRRLKIIVVIIVALICVVVGVVIGVLLSLSHRKAVHR